MTETPRPSQRSGSFAGAVHIPGELRVVLADDDELVRGALAALLSLIGGITVVAEADNGAQLLEQVERCRPDLVVTDISMPRMDGLQAIARIRTDHPHVRTLVVSMLGSGEAVRDALRSGALGYVRKDAAAAELQDAVRRVMAGQEYLGPSARRALGRDRIAPS